MKIFRLEEANALLPAVRPLVAELIATKRDLAIGLLEADTARHLRPDGAESVRAQTLAHRARGAQLRIVELVEALQAHGCVVKDLDLGLLDFPALRGDEVVNLCWKAGEPEIAFWHGMDEGFAARKPLDQM